MFTSIGYVVRIDVTGCSIKAQIGLRGTVRTYKTRPETLKHAFLLVETEEAKGNEALLTFID